MKDYLNSDHKESIPKAALPAIYRRRLAESDAAQWLEQQQHRNLRMGHDSGVIYVQHTGITKTVCFNCTKLCLPFIRTIATQKSPIDRARSPLKINLLSIYNSGGYQTAILGSVWLFHFQEYHAQNTFARNTITDKDVFI